MSELSLLYLLSFIYTLLSRDFRAPDEDLNTVHNPFQEVWRTLQK